MTRYAIIKHRARVWRQLEDARQAAYQRNRLDSSRFVPGRYEALSQAAGAALLALVNACFATRVEVWQAMRYLGTHDVPRMTHRPGCERFAECRCHQLAKHLPRLRAEHPPR